MIGVNHYSNGKWYIESKNDLYDIYITLNNFYRDNFEGLYGKAVKVRIKYDSELGVFILMCKPKGRLFSKKHKFFIKKDIGLAKKIKLLFESIVARGTINAPLANIDIRFRTGVSEKSRMSSINYLINSMKLSSPNGYFSLYGKIY